MSGFNICISNHHAILDSPFPTPWGMSLFFPSSFIYNVHRFSFGNLYLPSIQEPSLHTSVPVSLHWPQSESWKLDYHPDLQVKKGCLRIGRHCKGEWILATWIKVDACPSHFIKYISCYRGPASILTEWVIKSKPIFPIYIRFFIKLKMYMDL